MDRIHNTALALSVNLSNAFVQGGKGGKVGKPNSSAMTPKILGGMVDQNGQRWIAYGTQACNVIFALSELQNSPSKVFNELTQVGLTVLTSRSNNHFRNQIEQFDTYASGLVVFRPGWIDGIFGYGDGSVIKSKRDTRAFFSACEAERKFAQAGTLQSWQRYIGGLVSGQPLPLFLISYAFVGPLLELAPVDIQNTIVELVGASEQGKSTLAIGAGSVWGGDPSSSTGFGDSWDITTTKIDELASRHRGHLLILDEANLGKSGNDDRRGKANFLRESIFKFTNTGTRQRYNDPFHMDHTRGSLLSTSNEPVHKIISDGSHGAQACRSRVLTLYADRKYGIFDFLPAGFDTACDAVVALHRCASAHYGLPGRHFVWSLAERYWANKARLLYDIQTCYERYLRWPTIAQASPRHAKTLAITCAAHEIACCFGIIPRRWGSIDAMIDSLALSEPAAPRHVASAADRIVDYIRAHKFLDARTLNQPLLARDFDDAAGIWALSQGTFVVSTTHFQRQFPDYRELLRELRSADQLDSESGAHTKLSKKAPSGICADHGRRAYFFKGFSRAS